MILQLHCIFSQSKSAIYLLGSERVFTTQSWVLTTLIETESFWKHREKRRKCWWPAFSPFSRIVFYPFIERNHHFSNIKFDVFKYFQFGKGQNFVVWLTHYRWQILDSSKLKEFADDNFKFDENGRKLSKRVENAVGKGEIAHYEQFLLSPQCLQKGLFPKAVKKVSLCGNGLRVNHHRISQSINQWFLSIRILLNPLPNNKVYRI